MPTNPKHHREPWTPEDVAKLRELAEANMPTRLMGLKIGRTPGAVASEAHRQGISLEPHNVSPYGVGGKRRSPKK